MKREFLQNLKVGEEALPKELIDAIMEENGRDIQKAKTDAVKPYSDYEDIKKERDTQKDARLTLLPDVLCYIVLLVLQKTTQLYYNRYYS